MWRLVSVWLAVVVAGCGSVNSDAPDGGGPGEADADPNAPDADPSAPDAAPPDAMPPCNWTAPVIVASVNSTSFEGMATESPDGLALYFTKTISLGTNSDLYVATRSGAGMPFGAPSAVSGFDTPGVFEDAAELSATGLEIFFRRTIAEDPMSGIWTATRPTAAGSFGAAQSLGVDGYSPAISADGLTLYYVSITEGKVKAMSRASIGGLWGPPHDVLTTPYRTIDVSGDELRILLSDGPNNFDSVPVAIATRTRKDDPFGAAVPIDVLTVPGDTSNSKNASWSADERTMYLEMQLPAGQGGTDIYFSTCE